MHRIADGGGRDPVFFRRPDRPIERDDRRVLPERLVGVDQRRRAALAHDLRLRLRLQRAALHLLHIPGHPQDAVRIVPGEVRAHQMVRDLGGRLLIRADRATDLLDEPFQWTGRNQDLGHAASPFIRLTSPPGGLARSIRPMARMGNRWSDGEQWA